MSNIDRWNYLYAGVSKEPTRTFSSDDITYCKGYEWLKDCNPIEDWGCGFGYFNSLCQPGQCIQLDASNTPHADAFVDLCVYKSHVPGIFMRHVLEHNEGWRIILRNALDSFQKRMVLVLFTPFSERTYDTEPWESGPQHRCYSFAKSDILDAIAPIQYILDEGIITLTQFGSEHVFYLWK